MSGGKLPEGWVNSKFTDLMDVQGGTQPPKSEFIPEAQNGYIRLLQIRDFGKKPVPTYIPETKKLKTCRDEDLLIGRYGASLGRICTGHAGAYNVALAKVIYPHEFERSFIRYYLESEIFQFPLRLLSRSAQNGFNKEDLSRFDFLLAPLAEQKIIAEKLDTLLAQVDSTKARLEQIPQILKRFRQAVLAVAVSGKLADKQDENHHWQEQQLSHVASHIVDCPHSTPKWSSEGKYCVRTTAFSPFYLDLSNQGYVDEETYQNRIQRLKPEPDDILYSREGTIGIACQIPKGVELCLGQRMVLIRASAKISSKYLTIVLNSNHILKIVRSKTMGSTAPRINMSDIKSYPIPLPPLQEQHEIVRRVEQLFAYADTIEKQVNNALTRVNSLTQSILAKAFRGELTAQWRAENPDLISGENSAAALLEKIKAERAASGGKKTSRKKS
ncbi:restriction endonuclease subunit S [Citrobacter portucalensis]|uniref:restriction endonuclease subunit S n=1 Tax=Citrobacter portucalensis TaxID=1639133 RepID=UPI00226B8543|nr:restriction endonuclease subunit S [Citrobacter portucalensis]MCX9064565.1 restriction endonuclease subunit S [Citrobacter portucalensis]